MRHIYRIAFIIILGFASLPVMAQNFGGGLYAGLSASQVHGDALGGYDLVGVNLGFLTNYQLTERSKIQMELAFLQKGSREKISDTSNFYKMRLNYIEIPLLYVYRWGEFSLEIGPAIDILVTSHEEQQGFEIESYPPFNRINITGIAGVTWHFSRKWAINLRTNNSIFPIREGAAATNGSPTQIRLGGAGQRNIVLSFAMVYDITGE